VMLAGSGPLRLGAGQWCDEPRAADMVGIRR
jgi:hypothetical protein